MWTGFFLGLGVGVLLSVPVAYVWNRRTARRVRDLEQRTRAAERLAEFGTLTSGLAHEIKNPLSTIGLNIQLIQEDLDEVLRQAEVTDHPPDRPAVNESAQRLRRRFDSVARETAHLRTILDDFLRFAGRMKLERESTDLNALADELVDFFSPQARQASAHLRTQLTAEPAEAAVDAGLVKQALLNLLINAAQAMDTAREKDEPHGGADELIVRTQRAKHLGEDEIQIHVTDTGPGMAEDVAAKVLQPYYSTKRGGTGLGLPTARRIAEEHGGRLLVHSEPGRGSDFALCLPVHPREPDADRTP